MNEERGNQTPTSNVSLQKVTHLDGGDRTHFSELGTVNLMLSEMKYLSPSLLRSTFLISDFSRSGLKEALLWHLTRTSEETGCSSLIGFRLTMGSTELTLELFIFLMAFFTLRAMARVRRIEEEKRKLRSLPKKNEVLDLLPKRINETSSLLTHLRTKAKEQKMKDLD